MPPEKLVSVFEAEVRRLLREHQVYTIEAMGYLDSETPNPNYLGICHWLENPRVSLEESYFDSTSNESVSRYNKKPSNEEVKLETLSADISGLFELSFLSIGQLLTFYEGNSGESRFQKLFGESVILSPVNEPLYWLNYNSTVVHLSTLSDRIFKYMEKTFSISGIQVKRKQRGDFELCVFCELETYLNQLNGSVKIDLEDIFERASRVKNYRNLRNIMIHQISSHTAKYEITMLSESQLVDESGHVRTPISSADANGIVDEHSPVELCKGWYSDLIEMANMIFLIEKQSRI